MVELYEENKRRGIVMLLDALETAFPVCEVTHATPMNEYDSWLMDFAGPGGRSSNIFMDEPAALVFARERAEGIQDGTWRHAR